MSFWKDFKNKQAGDDRSVKDEAAIDWPRRIDSLTREGRHREAVALLEAVPAEKRTDEMKGLLARAYNNCDEYEKALPLLFETEEYGKDTANWNYRVGYAYYYLHEYEKSKKYFSRAAELDPSDPDAKWFVARCEWTRPMTDRVSDFWKWFEDNEAELDRLLRADGDHGAEITGLLSAGCSLLGENVFYNVGGDHELTFCVEGHTEGFFINPLLTAAAPEGVKERWLLLPCKQPVDTSQFTFRMYDRNVDMGAVKVRADYDAESGTFAIRGYHPELAKLTTDQAVNALYIILEVTVGEGTIYNYVSEVTHEESAGDDFMPLASLADAMKAAREAAGKKFTTAPNTDYSTYRRESTGRYDRQDIITGYTRCPELDRQFYAGNPRLFMGFADRGVRACYLAITGSFPESDDPKAEMLAFRHQLEDRLEALFADGTLKGEVIGAAMGGRYAYVDLLVYDSNGFQDFVWERPNVETLVRRDDGSIPAVQIMLQDFIDAQYAKELYDGRNN